MKYIKIIGIIVGIIGVSTLSYGAYWIVRQLNQITKDTGKMQSEMHRISGEVQGIKNLCCWSAKRSSIANFWGTFSARFIREFIS